MQLIHMEVHISINTIFPFKSDLFKGAELIQASGKLTVNSGNELG